MDTADQDDLEGFHGSGKSHAKVAIAAALIGVFGFVAYSMTTAIRSVKDSIAGYPFDIIEVAAEPSPDKCRAIVPDSTPITGYFGSDSNVIGPDGMSTLTNVATAWKKCNQTMGWKAIKVTIYADYVKFEPRGSDLISYYLQQQKVSVEYLLRKNPPKSEAPAKQTKIEFVFA
jgi:hypothetical protein